MKQIIFELGNFPNYESYDLVFKYASPSNSLSNTKTMKKSDMLKSHCSTGRKRCNSSTNPSKTMKRSVVNMESEKRKEQKGRIMYTSSSGMGSNKKSSHFSSKKVAKTNEYESYLNGEKSETLVRYPS